MIGCKNSHDASIVYKILVWSTIDASIAWYSFCHMELRHVHTAPRALYARDAVVRCRALIAGRGHHPVARSGPLLQPPPPSGAARRVRAHCSSSRSGGCTPASSLSAGLLRPPRRPPAGIHPSSLPETEGVLLPDWEMLVLHFPGAAAENTDGNASAVGRRRCARAREVAGVWAPRVLLRAGRGRSARCGS